MLTVGSSFGPSKWTSKYLSTSKLSPITLPLCSSEGTCSRANIGLQRNVRGGKNQKQKKKKREREREKRPKSTVLRIHTKTIEDDQQGTLPPLFWRFQSHAVQNQRRGVVKAAYEVPIKPFDSASIEIPYPHWVTTPSRDLSNNEVYPAKGVYPS